MKLIKSEMINTYSIEGQLYFYKEQFESKHCELDGCGHEIHNGWVIYKDHLYCPECYEWKSEYEKKKAEAEIQLLQQKIDRQITEFEISIEEGEI